MSSGVALHLDGVPVVISPYLPPDAVMPRDGKIYAGSQAALDRALAEANKWVSLRTHPPTMMNRETGELIELEEQPEQRCPGCGGWHG